jgi:hypothetical protein
MTDLRQDDVKMQMEGAVTPPPDLNLILARIGTAALNKKTITLTPGEARILTDYLKET